MSQETDGLSTIPAIGRTIRLGVLISGGGRTLVNFVSEIREGKLDAEIPTVIASRDCGGIARAAEAGIPCELVARKTFADAKQFSERVFQLLDEANVDLVLLAGFLSLLVIPERYRWRVMNIHPALLPAFGGKGFYGEKVHQAVIDRGVKITGCTVHFADPVYDAGPIILQQSVPVLDDDTADTVAARVFEAECEAYPEAVRRYASGRLSIREGRVMTAAANRRI